MTPGDGGDASIDLADIDAGGDVTAVIGEYRKYVTVIPSEKKPPLFVNVPPLPAHPLVGRDELLATLADQLIAGESPALSTAGMPGAGKTALAVALAHHRRVLARFTDGVLWAGLGPEPDIASIQAEWARALGVDISNEPDAAKRRRIICNAIGQRRVLMIIDDAWDDAPARLLRCGGNVVALLTTRNDDIARGFAPRGHTPVPELDEDPSLLLLHTLAPRAWAAAPDGLRKLARASGGLPLTLMVLGGYLNQAEHSAFPVLIQEALDALADPAAWLALPGGRLGSNEMQPLDAVIALSLKQLQKSHPGDVDAFYALGAFAPKPARFSLAAAQAVAQCDAATLARLAARNLLETEGDSLALHQSLAAVAAHGCPDAARQRHRDYYLDWVNQDRKDWRRIERVYPQILHAWQRQMAAAPDDETVIRFTDALDTYQERRGLRYENLSWIEAALAIAEKQNDDKKRARFLNNIGMVYDALGEKQKALDYYQQALPLRRQVGDRSGEATTLSNIGMVYSALGEKQKALDYYQQAVELLQQISHVWYEFVVRGNIAVLYMQQDQWKKAEMQL